MQREESIEAQIRAMRDFAEHNDILIVHEYIDRAKSATTIDRPQFQQMLADSAKGGFDLVLAHKLDRFARNRYDSIGCRMELKENGVSLVSVLEQFDSDSPESIITESVLEAMAEYYSLNLAREVRKGQRENAYKSMWTGGLPPYGYDVDPETKRLVINEHEAEAVRIIFKMFVRGEGYLTIADELNRLGYKTKRGTDFTKTSFYNMLRNEKYIGNYVYNRSQPKDVRGRRNGHTYKDRSEWITNEGTVPAWRNSGRRNTARNFPTAKPSKPTCCPAKSSAGNAVRPTAATGGRTSGDRGLSSNISVTCKSGVASAPATPGLSTGTPLKASCWKSWPTRYSISASRRGSPDIITIIGKITTGRIQRRSRCWKQSLPHVKRILTA